MAAPKLELPVVCACGARVTADDVLDAAYECARGHYFTRPEAGDSNICPECSRAGRRIGTACPACRELLDPPAPRPDVYDRMGVPPGSLSGMGARGGGLKGRGRRKS